MRKIEYIKTFVPRSKDSRYEVFIGAEHMATITQRGYGSWTSVMRPDCSWTAGMRLDCKSFKTRTLNAAKEWTIRNIKALGKFPEPSTEAYKPKKVQL